MIKKLLYLSNLIFLVLFFILAWHNRLALDDFYFLNNTHKYGILHGAEMEYKFGSSRWLSISVIYTILGLMPYVKALFLFNLLTISGLVISFSYFIKNILNRCFSFKIGTFLVINLAVFTINAFFYSTIDIGQTWFWLSASPTYLWSFGFFILGCGILLSSKRYNMLKSVLLAFSFFYIGGSAESFAAAVLLGLLISIIALHFYNLSLVDRKIYLSRLYLAFSFCLGALIVLYFGPGNAIRRGWLGEISIFRAFVLNIETTGWMGLHWLSRVVPFALLFSLPLLYAGRLLSAQNAITKERASTIRKKLFKAALFYGVLVYILNYPITYLLCGISPPRALTAISFFTWALFAFSFLYVGYKAIVGENLAKSLIVITLGMCLLLNGYNVVHQYTITNEYATKYDLMMEELMQNKNSISVIFIAPLPPSGMLTSMELSPDSLADNNMFVKKALGLKADIILRK